jgi:hypothetical protein
MDDDDNDHGMRLIRGPRRKYPRVPRTLIEVPPGQVVLIAVRVAAHLAGCGKGDYTDTLCRAYDVVGREELYRCGDLYVARAQLVAIHKEP